MSSGGSTYKDSFTIRYDNPTNEDRETSLFELGSNNPNRAIPFPIGNFLGNAEPNTVNNGKCFTQFLPTSNAILTVFFENATGDFKVSNYDIATDSYTDTLNIPFASLSSFPQGRPCVIPKLPYQKADGTTGVYEGIVIGCFGNTPNDELFMVYPNPDDFTQLQQQQIAQNINLNSGQGNPPFLYDVDLDMVICVGFGGAGITFVKEVRAEAEIGTGVVPAPRTQQSLTFAWGGAGYSATAKNTVFKLFKVTNFIANEQDGNYLILLAKGDSNGLNRVAYGKANANIKK